MVLFLSLSFVCACSEEQTKTTSPTSTATQSTLRYEKAGTYEIIINDDSFSPQTLITQAGSTIKWINKGSTWHAIADLPPEGESIGQHPYGESGRIEPGGSYTQSFALAGTWNYFDPHNWIVGKIIIE